MNDHVEDYLQIPDRFAFGPADTEALARRDASRRAAEQAALSVEQAINPPHGQDPNEVIGVILAERCKIHGDFTDDAEIAQALKDVMRRGLNWVELDAGPARSVEQTQTKIARILSGDPNHPDHWKDIQGYPRLVEQRL